MPDNDEKHIEQDRKAKRVRDREEERQKRRKDGIPLWAYSKVLEYWIPTLIATWGLTESVVNVCNYDTPNWTIKVWLWTWAASSYYGALKTVFKVPLCARTICSIGPYHLVGHQYHDGRYITIIFRLSASYSRVIERHWRIKPKSVVRSN